MTESIGAATILRPTQACYDAHLSEPWAVAEHRLRAELELARQIGWREWAEVQGAACDDIVAGWGALLDIPLVRLSAASAAARADRRLFGVARRTVAIVPIVGALSKGGSKHGTSTSLTRRAIRQAVADPDIRSIVLAIDSPGGRVPGTHELAEDVRAAAARKPTVAQVEDMSASAAVWVMSGAGEIVANHREAEVGSVGTYAVLYDMTRAAEMDGVKVHVISTGAMKGAGVPGSPITDEMLGSVRERVEAVNSLFVEALQRNRRLSSEQLQELSDGRTMGAQAAIPHGLVDGIRSLEATVEQLAEGPSAPVQTSARTDARLRSERLRLEEEALGTGR